ncbi:hypothetical protein NQZ68_033558 [Dissostichus eleginoides]|nr:hypothetical protein NQZ68_033558 [Dissostichus eleginoides]
MAELRPDRCWRTGFFFCVWLLLFLSVASGIRDVVSGSNETSRGPAGDTPEDPHHQTNSTTHKKAFPVLSFNYQDVRKPFVISLWILLALLMKLGEWPQD